jgi:hypothetical protein
MGVELLVPEWSGAQMRQLMEELWSWEHHLWPPNGKWNHGWIQT